MSALTTQDMVTLVRNQVTAIQGAAKQLIDFTIGSVLRSIVESNASVTLWLQGLILQLLATTRAATSSGTDLDSFVADFGLTRLIAFAASGQATFARFSATSQAIIPVGALVQSQDGTEQFAVTLDTTNPAYSATLNGYVIAANVPSLNLIVQASTAGAAGNVLAGSINTVVTPISGVDTVTNVSAFTNGADPETDAALRTRFVSFIASLSKATKAAIGNAIQSVQQGLSYTLTENQDYGGGTHVGYFYVVIDDGTGSPPAPLLSSVNNAIDAVRPTAVTFGVFAPIVETATVSMSIATAAGYLHATITGIVKTAIQNYINTLPLGQLLPFTKLAQIAYEASPGVTNVSAVTLNGGGVDLAATAQQVIKAGTVTVL